MNPMHGAIYSSLAALEHLSRCMESGIPGKVYISAQAWFQLAGTPSIAGILYGHSITT
jgi:hypothetical protein